MPDTTINHPAHICAFFIIYRSIICNSNKNFSTHMSFYFYKSISTQILRSTYNINDQFYYFLLNDQ